ncbi:hypothetical protein [Nonomuraea sp. NPDC049400]|uniref:hypothetical protein n=1 Tax=Nonomuraea sp. NPDC049400 TaxID=3364352 RepID=UPI0037B1567C
MLVQGAWHQPGSWAKLEAELHALGVAGGLFPLIDEPRTSLYGDLPMQRPSRR